MAKDDRYRYGVPSWYVYSGGPSGGSLTDGDYGDVVVSGGGTVMTLDVGAPTAVLFVNAAGAVTGDAARFSWNNTNKALDVSTNTSSYALRVRNADAAAGAMALTNTNVNGPSDFYATDNAGTAKISWGYGNASYSDAARAGRSYLWRNTGIDFVFARTGVVDGILKSDGKWGIGASTSLTAQLEVNGSTPDVYINGATSGWLRYSANGLAAPAFTTRSAGTKIVLYPSIDGSNVDFGIGLAAGNFWQSIAQASAGQQFTWYGGTTQLATLTGAAFLTINGSTKLNSISGTTGINTDPLAAVQLYVLHGSTPGGPGLAVPGATLGDQCIFGRINRATVDTTAGATADIGVGGWATSTKTAGVPNLINVGLFGAASGGDINYAIVTTDGNCLFNTGSGNSVFAASVEVTGALAAYGNVQIGDDGSDHHGINGLIDLNGTVGSSGQLATVNGTLPEWMSPANISGIVDETFATTFLLMGA